MSPQRRNLLVILPLFVSVACSDGPAAPAAPNALMADAIATSGATQLAAPTGAFINGAGGSPCMDVSGASSRPGTPVILYPCHGGGNQQFTLNAAGELRAMTGTMCVDAYGGAGRVGDAIIVWPCHGGANQRWILTTTRQLLGINGLCIAPRGSAAAPGTPLLLAQCSTTAVQTWGPPAATVAAVRLSTSGTTLAPGDSVQLTATALDASGAAINGRGVTWATSDARVASVSASGVTAGVAAGSATVTATVGGRSASAPVTVSGRASVPVLPGQSLQAAVDANPKGTTFIVKAGVHHKQSVVPKDSDTFVGETGTVLTGDDATPYAFRWAGAAFPSGVRLRKLIIEHYAPGKQMGAILAGGADAAHGTRGWVVDSCEVRYNAGGGIRLGDRMQLLRTYIHHNDQIGVVGVGDSVRVEGNELAYNNYRGTYDFLWEAGGAKFVLTNGLVVRNNYSHDNTGPGLWADIDNRGTLIEGNRVEDNAGAGIIEEISRSAVIRNNTIQRNGAGYHVWVHGSGILVQNSSDVEIYGNTVAGNYNGITAIQQNRGAGIYGPWVTRNVYVHDNDVTMTQGLTGFAQDVGDNTLFSTRTMRFERNRYAVGGRPTPFAWANTWVSITQWKGYEQDAAGTFR